ncbi:hypothetical protein [Nocardioides sp. InS609-2]|uniref:hypothetical protein n=1 Tax=Nocardioides sp. InS609-2 TaxID=2760705 RepID=UPI0020C0140B|nr:hypothetical protein [Nocardioides sp. InS609-2]
MEQGTIDEAIQAYYGSQFDESARLTSRSAQGALEFIARRKSSLTASPRIRGFSTSVVPLVSTPRLLRMRGITSL